MANTVSCGYCFLVKMMLALLTLLVGRSHDEQELASKTLTAHEEPAVSQLINSLRFHDAIAWLPDTVPSTGASVIGNLHCSSRKLVSIREHLQKRQFIGTEDSQS